MIGNMAFKIKMYDSENCHWCGTTLFGFTKQSDILPPQTHNQRRMQERQTWTQNVIWKCKHYFSRRKSHPVFSKNIFFFFKQFLFLQKPGYGLKNTHTLSIKLAYIYIYIYFFQMRYKIHLTPSKIGRKWWGPRVNNRWNNSK